MSGSITVAPNPAQVGDSLVVSGTEFGARAVLTTALAGAQNDLKFTAVTPGTYGNGITIVYADPGGNNAVLSVGVVTKAITVNLATGAGGAITSTAALVKAAIEASAPAHALVTVTYPSSNDGTGVVTALSSTPLASGTDDTVEVEFIKESNADADVRYSEAAASGAFGSAGNLTYKAQEAGSVLVKARVAGVVVDTVEVEVFSNT